MLFCCSSSFHGVFTYKFIRYPSSQASADPTSNVCIVAYSFSIYFFMPYQTAFLSHSSVNDLCHSGHTLHKRARNRNITLKEKSD